MLSSAKRKVTASTDRTAQAHLKPCIFLGDACFDIVDTFSTSKLETKPLEEVNDAASHVLAKEEDLSDGMDNLDTAAIGGSM